MEKRYLALFALLFALVFFSTSGCIIPPANGTIEITNLSMRIATGSNPVLGNANASIYIVEFTDFQCPYCQRHATQTFPQIKSNYIDTVKARYYLRDDLL
ncbi:MAG: thioredoxin domain-containing protein, partial [Candidatus ainarchaeum sp.]|nr:thioredoxin domain-containing protein [Candidatus ainarchaeum sp.]